MPMFVETAPTGPQLVVEPSLTVEIDWALSAAHFRDPAPERVLVEFYAAHPGLAEEVRSLWSPSEQLSYPGYPELSVLADRAGILLGLEGDGLLDQLAASAAEGHAVGGLAAETPEDRERILTRLRILSTSEARRQRYFDVIGRLWSEVGPIWEAYGRASVEAAVRQRRAARPAPPARPSWRDLVGDVPTFCTDLDSLVAALGERDQLVVVPAFFTRKGLVIDLPGRLLVGVPIVGSDDRRARAEGLARRLKAVSDPTRLALLEALGRRPMTVSDLSERFSLAQPTVSNHVKVMRDAGLVESMGQGRRRELTLRPGALDDLSSQLTDFVGGTVGGTPAARQPPR